MAQVPYSPVPDVSENLAPTPKLSVNTPPDAFGAAVGKGLSTLGEVTQQASGEIFARAQAMQQLKNETDTRRQSVVALQQISDRTAQFQTQYGEHAGPEQYQQFMKDISDIREKNRAGLTNPASQALYDAESFRYVGNAIMSGGRHSAEQLKSTAIVTNQMAQKAAIDSAAIDPLNDKAVQDSLTKAESTARQDADFHGISDPAVVNEQVAIAKSAVASKQITALLDQGKPEQARAILTKYGADGTIRGADMGPLQKTLMSQENLVGSKHIADGLRDGTNLAMGEKIVPMDSAKAAILGNESGGDYTAVGPTTKDGDHAYGKYQVKGSSLPGFLSQAGLPKMSPDEFRANPAAQEKVFETVFGGYMQKYGTFNKAAEAWFGGEGSVGKNVSGDGYTSVPSYLAKANATLYKNASVVDKVAMGRDLAQKQSPDNPIQADTTESRIVANHHQEIAEAKQSDEQKWGGIYTAVEAQKGKGAVSLDTMMQNPDFAKTYNALAPKEQLKTQAILATAARSDNVESEARQANFNRLQGQAYIDPEGFKAAKLYDTDLTAQQRSDLVNLHGTLLKNGVLQDPVLQKAMRDPGVIAVASTIGVSPKNKTEWSSFTGALAEDIKFARATGKEPNADDVQNMANKLVQDRAGSGIFFNDKEYRIPLHGIPEPVVTKEREMLRGKLGRDPTDNEIERLHALSLYVATQKKKAQPNG